MSDRAVGILNLEIGNLRSVSNAIYSLGYDPVLIEDAKAFDTVNRLVIPGVGAFHTAARRLAANGLQDAVRQFADTGKPVLGLCLGMQLLADFGEEGHGSMGMGLIPGIVERLDEQRVPAVPHVGWNSVEWLRDHPVLDKVKTGVDFYFVHSYRYAAQNPDDVTGVTTYGDSFPSVIGRKNVLGFQFHPEKSQANGLRLLENFCAWDGRC